MKGDFTRNTFDPAKQFTRVLMQQGRVQLDADTNEQTAILLHYLQTLAADLIGPYGGPQGNGGFQITPVTDRGKITDLQIGNGRYYVDGILCENPAHYDKDGKPIPVTYYGEAHYTVDNRQSPLPDVPFLVYLDVWERLITAVEDDTIREVALGGADTAARAQVVWQVKVTNKTANGGNIPAAEPAEGWPAWVEANWSGWHDLWQPENRGQLKARAQQGGGQPDNACITPPDARYRGAENQLYRVEIHDGGTAGSATFKWSRDNGSVIFPIRRLSGKVAVVEGLAGNGRFALQPGDWVEIVDDNYILQGRAEPLLKVSNVDYGDMRVTLESAPASTHGQDLTKHLLLRRWDHKADDPKRDVLTVKEGADNNGWFDLEAGIQIQYQSGATYRNGDYWLIPARTATGDVEWPGPVDNPDLLPPHGVTHHYAPLAIIVTGDGTVQEMRRQLKPLWEAVP